MTTDHVRTAYAAKYGDAPDLTNDRDWQDHVVCEQSGAELRWIVSRLGRELSESDVASVTDDDVDALRQSQKSADLKQAENALIKLLRRTRIGGFAADGKRIDKAQAKAVRKAARDMAINDNGTSVGNLLARLAACKADIESEGGDPDDVTWHPEVETP